MTRRQLRNARVVLTGASSGIGRALAHELAGQGCRLLLNARRHDRLESLREQLALSPSDCLIVPGDITLPETRQAIIETARDQWNQIDVLINNAGIGAVGNFSEANEQRLRRIFDVNFFAPSELIRAALPILRLGENPLVVNVGSVLGHRAVPLKSEYCASKFALHGLSDALRAELQPEGIDVLLVSPSTTDSDFFNAALEDQTGRDWKGKRPMSPQRVAQLTVRAIRSGKHEIILSAGGRALVWLDRLAPTLCHYLLVRFSR